MKRLLSLLLALIMITACVCSCGPQGDPVDTLKVTPSADKYRNFYEIFVSAFNDSDGDGVGDLQGIIDKLDYLNDGDPETDTDLGIDGIWLTPIMPSPSYHKYDVDDYYNIDAIFGDLDVFDKLMDECHKRGIKLVIDMVLNHCSSTHPLFVNACKQVLEGNLDGDAKYFSIKKFDDYPSSGYTRIGKGYYYESNFSEHMPEWNLNADCTRDYFADVAKFWLNKHNVDGFRLDATLYYTNEDTDGRSFLKWYYDMAKSIKSDVYMVGEHWTGNAEIEEMYQSGVDSFFAFGFAGAGGKFVNAVQISNAAGLAESVKNYCEETSKSNPDSINAFFLSNHDQIRSANYLSGVEAAGIKMAASLYMMMPGNSFIYYGEEIGTTQDASLSGDEFKREAMIWDSKKLPKIYVSGAAPDSNHASYGGVKQQQNDEKSILNFYKRVIKVKNQNPAIARGTITETDLSDDSAVCSFVVEYKGTRLLVAHNLSKDAENSVKLPANGELRAGLIASDSKDEATVKISDGSVVLPPYSTAVVQLND